jgi:hypothetical protein
LLGSSEGVGFGFGPDDARIEFVERVGGAEVEWSLGAAVSVIHPTAALADPHWLNPPITRECARVFHTSFIAALYDWSVVIMPAAMLVTAYLTRRALKVTNAKVGTMAKSPSLLEII